MSRPVIGDVNVTEESMVGSLLCFAWREVINVTVVIVVKIEPTCLQLYGYTSHVIYVRRKLCLAQATMCHVGGSE